MTDRYDQDMILGYVEGELSDDLRAAFETTLADDHELRQLVSQMRLDREALRSLAGMSAPVGLVDQVMQAQERDALLGDPAAPEPLPMVVPVSRWKVRRVLAYSGVAAVLLLSFGVVFMTLTPPDFLNQTPGLAQNQTPISPLDGTESGLAMIDEDAVYDGLGERALGRQLSEASKAQEPTVLAMKEDLAAVTRSATGDVAVDRSTIADAEGGSILEAESVASLASSSDALMPGDAAMSLAARQPVAVGGFAGLPEPMNTAGTRVIEEPGPYVGYAPASWPQNVQLQIASASPTQARRDIRDWAIRNSARVVDVPVRSPSDSFAAAGRSRAGGLVRGLASGPPPKRVVVEEASEQQLVLFVNDAQMPSLLAYLNRGRSQRADVVPILLDGKADKNQAPRETRLAKKTDLHDSAAGDTLAEALTENTAEQPAGADAPAPTVALSNRWVDIGSVWRNESSLQESDHPPSDNASAPPEVTDDKFSSADSDTPDAITPLGLTGSERSDAHESKTKRDYRAMRFEDFLNWDPPPPPEAPSPAATQPASQPQAAKQRRLQVIIRQVAESDLRSETKPAADTPTPDDGE